MLVGPLHVASSFTEVQLYAINSDTICDIVIDSCLNCIVSVLHDTGTYLMSYLLSATLSSAKYICTVLSLIWRRRRSINTWSVMRWYFGRWSSAATPLRSKWTCCSTVRCCSLTNQWCRGATRLIQFLWYAQHKNPTNSIICTYWWNGNSQKTEYSVNCRERSKIGETACNLSTVLQCC